MKWLDVRHLTVLHAVVVLLWPAVAVAQVIHTNHDHIPDFSANPTISSAANGSWSNPGTWTPARVPGPSDVVRIRHAVVYDSTTGDAGVIGVGDGGALQFATNQGTRLRVGTLLVLSGGRLEIGTAASPVASSATAEIIIKDQPLNATTDPDQYGTGLLVVNGTINVHGTVKAPTWRRLASEPQAGSSTLVVEQPVSGWQVNDVLVIPDSREDPLRQNDAQLERRTIQSISSDGRTITLSSPLTNRHPGARDLEGRLVFLPHVMNITRNVVIRSENPAGTRGHTMYTHRSTVDIRYAEYRDLGRTTIAALDNTTNHIGRYAMHLHHLIGPPPDRTPANGHQFTIVGNAVYDSNVARSRIKWPIAIHNSHYGLVQGNTVYNAGGSGIVTEDGSESYNVIEQNMVVRVLGEGDRRGVKSNGAVESGSQGIGFWFRGPNNYVRNNVAANSVETGIEAGYGFEYFQEYLGDIRIPNFKGADTTLSGQYTTKSGYSVPILEFSNNEVYGSPQGLTYWWLGVSSQTPVATAESVFKSLKMWHISRYPIYAYQGNKVVFDGLQVFGDLRPAVDCCNVIWYGDYFNADATIRNATIVGIEAVIFPYFAAGTSRVENSFVAVSRGLVNRTSGAPGSCTRCNMPDRIQVVQNVRFAALPGKPLRSISMEYQTYNGFADLDSKDEVFVYDYQGQSGNQFRVYYAEQATQNIAGTIAPCRDISTRPEVYGITCALSGSAPPPSGSPTAVVLTPPNNLRIIK